MHEDLVGYHLGALDADAMDRIEKQLIEDPALRRELERIRIALRPLDAEVDLDPPAGLASRAVRRVLQHRRPEPCLAAPTGQWRLTDLAIAASILFAISMIILPAINESRQQRAMADCRNNLRAIGVAISNYAERHNDYMPFYGTDAPYGIAGIYAPLLIESQFVTDRSVFICPSSGDAPQGIYSLGELRAAQADIQQLSSLLRSAGGSYGSLLGFRERGVYQSPRRNRLGGDSILVDRPPRPNEGYVGHSNSPNHAGHGQNALSRDGSVKFLCHPAECSGCYNLFVSLRHKVEPGRNETDQVFGPSDARLCSDDEQF
jgi:hypothetical protein